MIASKNCINLIKKFEGCKLESYLCPASKVTIGYGSILWSDGKPVKIGEKISLDTAEKLLMWELKNKSVVLQNLNLNQNQFDSCLSLIYNIGIGNWQKSTLLKKITLNLNDESIPDEFLKWNKARVNGKLTELKGLTKRRLAESNLYKSIP